MRIVLVTTSKGWGGMEIYPVRLAASLVKAGHDVRLSCRRESEVDRARAVARIEPIRLSRAEIGAFGPEVLDVHHPRDLLSALVLLARMGNRRPVAVYTKHTASPPGTRKRDPYHRLVVRALGGFITASRFVADGLAEAYGIERWKIHVVPYGYDAPADEGALDEPNESVGAALGVPAGRRIVGCVAQLSRGKLQHVLVEAIERIVSRGLEPHLLLVGGEADPGYRAELRGIAEGVGVSDRVTFLGERRDIGRLLRSMDVFVLPSRAESFGIAILEAWGASVPVVATRAGGTTEFVDEGLNGLLVPPDDPLALADAIESVLAGPALAAALAAEGRRTGEQRHTMAHAVARCLEAYARTLGRPEGSSP